MREQRRRRGGPVGHSGGATEAPAGSPTNGFGAVRLDPTEQHPRSGAGAARGPDDHPTRPQRPRIAGPLEAFLRHPFITVLPVLLLVGAAVLFGIERDPKYTAHSRITVGTTDINPFLLEEVVAGNQALAGSYSRAIGTEEVVTGAAQDVGLAPGVVAERLNASTVAGSTLIQVEATGPSEAASVDLANAGAENLIAYVRRINRTSEVDTLFKRYKKAQAEARRAERRTQALLQSRRRRSPAATEARIEQDLAALKASDLAARYRAASASASTASRLALIAPAADAKSDRRDVLNALLIAAGAGGLVLGFALALLRANWRILRALRQA